jgi:hypothetical protein
MLPLTRPQRQALMTLAMVATTVVPTMYVGLTAWRINRPGHLRDVEVEIGRSIGLQVTIEGVRYPRPGEVAYQGIVLRQEEPRRGGLTEIARAKSVRLRRNGPVLALEADGLALRAAGPKGAMAQIGVLLSGVGGGAYTRVSLVAPNCTVDLGGDSAKCPTYELRDLAATFQSDAKAPGLFASYRLVDRGGSTRCELALTRDRRGETVETVVALKTMEGLPLPARVLDAFFDSADWLGPDSRVQGALTLRQAGSADWQAEFSGDLIDVDLKTLFERRFPRHRMTGLAHVALKDARWANRPGQGFGWSRAEGELTAGSGTIGVELLQALAGEMKFRPSSGRPVSTRNPDVAFGALGFTFALTPDGEIALGGGFRNQFAPDDILVANDRPFFKAPSGTANVRGLLKTLFPASVETLGPVTADSQLVSRYLPLPPGVASRTPGRLGGN